MIKKNEEISAKFERLKEKNSEKENFNLKLSLEKNLFESKYEKITKLANDEINFLKTQIEKEKNEKENISNDIQMLYKKNKEYKLSYEELMQQNSELVERNRNLEKLSKIDKKTLQEYGSLQ